MSTGLVGLLMVNGYFGPEAERAFGVCMVVFGGCIATVGIGGALVWLASKCIPRHWTGNWDE